MVVFHSYVSLPEGTGSEDMWRIEKIHGLRLATTGEVMVERISVITADRRTHAEQVGLAFYRFVSFADITDITMNHHESPLVTLDITMLWQMTAPKLLHFCHYWQ